jgi:hypothetical protein
VPSTGTRQHRAEKRLEELVELSGKSGFVVLGTRSLKGGLVASYAARALVLNDQSEEAQQIVRRLMPPSGAWSIGGDSTHALPRQLFDLFERQNPLQARDGSGTWWRCVVRNHQEVVSPGISGPAVSVDTLVLQESEPQHVLTSENLNRMLELCKDSVAVCLSTLDQQFTDVIMASKPLAILLLLESPEDDTSTLNEQGDESSWCSVANSLKSFISSAREGLPLSVALQRSRAFLHFRLLCRCEDSTYSVM